MPARRFTAALAASLSLTAVQAQAQAPAAAAGDATAEEVADLQCTAVFAIFAAQPGSATQGAVGLMYFLGRLEGRRPAVDWLVRLRAYSATLTGADLEPHVQRCGHVLVEKGAAMTAAGTDLTS